MNRLKENQHWKLVWGHYVAWLKRAGLHKQAIDNSREAVAINPDDGRLRLQNALFEMQRHGNVEVSIAYFTLETQKHPENPNAWLMLARALSTAGRTEEANEAVMKATSLQNRMEP